MCRRLINTIMNHQRKPLISVVTVCYNAVNEIEKTILSVLNQTYDNIEYIVIDGGSNDGSVDIIKKYADCIAYWVSEPDRGIYDAMNKGIRAAKGEWVNFMNAGDRFENMGVLEQFSEYNLIYLKAVYGNTKFVTKQGVGYRTAKDVHYISKDMPTSHQSFFIRTEIAKEFRFDLKYKYAADYHMIYAIYRKYGPKSVAHLPFTVAEFEAIDGLSMLYPNEVFRETLKVRDYSLDWAWCMLKYYIKKSLGRS